MAALLYIHGFLSSPLSAKAQQVKSWLAKHRPGIRYYCPQLSPYPSECAQLLHDVVAREQTLYLMGSSMGGFWATYLAERYQLKAVLINPAVNVFELMPPYLNIPLKNYHHEQTYRLTEEHLQELRAYACHNITPEHYWLLVQTADETLDYRLAVAKYAGSLQTVEQGGDHSFQDFERHLPASIEFFEQ